MTSSPTRSEGRVRPKSVLANADATITLSEGACVVTVLRSVGGQAAAMGAGGWFFLRTRLLRILLAICCSNEEICSGFLGKVVGQLAPERCLIGREKRRQAIGRQRVNGIVVLNRANQCLKFIYSFLLLGGSLRSSHHCLYVRWQSRLISEVVVTQPSLFCCCKVPGD